MKIGTMTQFSNSYLAIVFDELKLMGLNGSQNFR
jgi:hypothetical protein